MCAAARAMETKCKSCGARMFWAVAAKSGKRLPVNAEPAANGNLVLALRSKPPAPAELIAEAFDAEKHEGRNRFTSHFSNCPQSAQHRRKA